MVEFIHPGITRPYYFQPNALQCWSAVALALWRSKHGRRGPGNTVDELFARSGGQPFLDVLDFSTEVNIEMMSSVSGSLDAAAATVRARMPRYMNTPTGLPDHAADRLFRWLGCASTPLDATVSPAALKNLLRSRGPIAIFTRNPGHLQLIVGYWEGDPEAPQVILFNPERYIIEAQRLNQPNIDPMTIREDRLLWAHWRSLYCGNLVEGKGWHY